MGLTQSQGEALRLLLARMPLLEFAALLHEYPCR